MPDFVSNLFSLEDRVTVITGASSGIGHHLAQVFARAGSKVIVVARREDKLIQLSESIAAQNGKARHEKIDLLDCNDFHALAQNLSNHFGPIDTLVNAAGVNLRQHADDVTRQGWETTLELNLTVPFFLTQSLIGQMRSKGFGNIINIASLQSYRAFENGIAYGASKAGIVQLTRAMAQAWSKYNITANAITPGFFPTELTSSVFEDKNLSRLHANATAIGRNGQMTDLDGTAIYLASRASAYVTGQNIAVDGGYLAK